MQVCTFLPLVTSGTSVASVLPCSDDFRPVPHRKLALDLLEGICAVHAHDYALNDIKVRGVWRRP